MIAKLGFEDQYVACHDEKNEKFMQFDTSQRVTNKIPIMYIFPIDIWLVGIKFYT